MPTSKRAKRPGTKSGGERAERYHHGDLRDALVAAAERTLAAAGPEALSLRQLARDLDVSHNAPYRHFATREALLAAVAAAGFRDLSQRTRAAMERAEPEQRMKARGRAYVGFALERPAVFRLMFSGVVRGRDHPELLAAAAESFMALRGAVASNLTPAAPNETTVAAWALVHGLAHLLIDAQLPLQLFGSRTSDELVDAVLSAWVSRRNT